MTNGPTPEERVQLETVDHKLRTSVAFGIVCALLLGGAMYAVLR